jgi:hypothetical protein
MCLPVGVTLVIGGGKQVWVLGSGVMEVTQQISIPSLRPLAAVVTKAALGNCQMPGCLGS